MRILQIFNRYRERGGEEKSAQRIYEQCKDDHEITKCWFDSSDWDGPGGPPAWKQAILIGENPESLARIRKASLENRCEVWLLHNVIPVVSLGVYELARDLRIPIVQYLHNFRPFSVSGSLWANNQLCKGGLSKNFWPEVRAASWQKSRIKTAVLAWHLKCLHASGNLDAVQRWIGISDFMSETFISAGIDEERVVTVRHSWDAMAEVPQTSDSGYYLFLGRLVPEKGIRCLLDAWRHLTEKLGDATPKLIIGGVGSCEAEVVAAAAELATVDYRNFVDGDQKRELLTHCRAMLAPSVWWEPLGLVTYEAYDWGKPMIAARTGGLTETISDGVTGFLHLPNDSLSLVNAVEKLESHSSKEREKMGQAGRSWLLNHAGREDWKTAFTQALESMREKGLDFESY